MTPMPEKTVFNVDKASRLYTIIAFLLVALVVALGQLHYIIADKQHILSQAMHVKHLNYCLLTIYIVILALIFSAIFARQSHA